MTDELVPAQADAPPAAPPPKDPTEDAAASWLRRVASSGSGWSRSSRSCSPSRSAAC